MNAPIKSQRLRIKLEEEEQIGDQVERKEEKEEDENEKQEVVERRVKEMKRMKGKRIENIN